MHMTTVYLKIGNVLLSLDMRNDLDYIDVNDIYEDLEKIKINQKKFTVKDAIFDLPKLKTRGRKRNS